MKKQAKKKPVITWEPLNMEEYNGVSNDRYNNVKMGETISYKKDS